METESLCLLPTQMLRSVSCNPACSRGGGVCVRVMVQSDYKRQRYTMSEWSLSLLCQVFLKVSLKSTWKTVTY